MAKLSGKGRRGKGNRGELEFFKLLNKFLPERLQTARRLGQARDGGLDGSVARVQVEVKRQENIRLNQWLAQARLGSGEFEIPAVAYRQNNQPWRVVVELDVKLFAAFCRYQHNLIDSAANYPDSLPDD